MKRVMNQSRRSLSLVGTFGVLSLAVILLAPIPQVGEAASSGTPDEQNKRQQYRIQIFSEIFDDPILANLYARATGLPGYAVAVTVDSTGDTVDVEVDLERELQRMREELRRAQEELERLDPDVRKQMDIDLNQMEQNMEQALQSLEDPEFMQKMDSLSNIDVRITRRDSRPFLGISVADLDFKDAYERHYDYNYGVLVTGVVDGTPADEAGLRKGDIIMEFNGGKVRYRGVLKNMIDSKNIGDKIRVKYFRDEEIITTTLTLEPRAPRIPDLPHSEEAEGDDESMDKEDWGEVDWDEDWESDWDGFQEGFLSKGYGGGGWIPVYSMVDLGDINGVIGDLGFTQLPESGILMHGGGGQGPIGKGWFIGGMGAGYSFDRRNNTTHRRMKFSTSYGGVTLDKRYRPTDNFVIAPGLVLGGAGVELEVAQTQGDVIWDSLGTNLTGSGNSYLHMKKNYLLVNPRVTFMYRFLPWLALRTEVGYALGMSFKSGWEAQMGGDTYEIEGSPNSNFYHGPMISIGPWFGF
ncbi:MAG: PDZ domain-containing protein [Candidatus Marinimicrobia bacterium]|nr:PDZ domain-containing protein [Candidatus Neomarinimicrobiota bacterium]MCF7829161.1 PDZ domain-containing protein [Candidatus Neomarinimicrobiota bacterium]MCF7881186.1 PDZ domain-containing protein [Candidatus Neomarinimicrobiota bacterium]